MFLKRDGGKREKTPGRVSTALCQGGSGLADVEDAGVVGGIVDDRRHAPPPPAAAPSPPPADPAGSRGRWKLMVSLRHHHAIIFIHLLTLRN